MGDKQDKPCKRCKVNPATMLVRLDSLCDNCFSAYVSQKVVKRLSQPLKELRASTGRPPRYLLGLSLGSSSAGLLQVLDANLRWLKDANPRNVYELHVVHIDTNLAPSTPASQPPSARLLQKYCDRFPDISIDSVPISAVLDAQTIDWTALPGLQADLEPTAALRHLLESLPSVTSRVDILRLLLRHLLFHIAAQRGCTALMMGYNTTALAELTLSETAKGRGYAIPWLVSDGSFPLTSFAALAGKTEIETEAGSRDVGGQQWVFPVYYPLRDILRKEIVAYNSMADVAMAELTADDPGVGGASGSVVSHKELSIEDVMTRHFAEVEDKYPNVIANVVRTTGKLEKPANRDACGMCGMTRDELGEARWKGEIGLTVDDAAALGITNQLCYGCERSLRG
ncbi:conserved hypothetical protein [Verticillium alfalfae VaMs.102]|uniref:Cytoplasmic tRNA 2-thiolation protein 2 n=1 Tax=Verticillium alfalfae (strain VaMs.102 / ATCC MYA-4576 / FGSC 10136) TaxID=526221 RepID=C9SR88_VERA1|nr:conserved hypothetical protein [Verticillium alfalfae VaMs.102]EEY20890.1 conserved hypothetical protein [Verticillium alfalfae VaMs.102]